MSSDRPKHRRHVLHTGLILRVASSRLQSAQLRGLSESAIASSAKVGLRRVALEGWMVEKADAKASKTEFRQRLNSKDGSARSERYLLFYKLANRIASYKTK